MKRLFFAALLGLFAWSTYGQQLSGGAKAGLNITNWSTDFDNISSRLAFHLGGYVNYSLLDDLSLQGELLFNQTGAKSTGDPEGRIVTNYMSIPLLVMYPVADAVNIYGGVQISFLLDAKSVITSGPNEGEEFDENDEFTGGDFAFVLGGEYAINENVTAGLRLALGLLNVAEDEGDEIKNVVIQLYAAAPLFPK
ncbi:MAG: porin family protein [Saprospiraceae bacterium]|nr:porin family protein [Saprospiraceae bacterium]